MSAPRRLLGSALARPGAVAIVLLGLAGGTIIHQTGWAPLGHYAEVRALSDGRKNVDPWHWETGDVAYIDGHYYSVKSPGMAAISVPPYLLLEAVGGLDVAGDAALRARDAEQPRWAPNEDSPWAQYGYDRRRAVRVEQRIEAATPVVWLLTLIAAVIPSVLLLFLVRGVGERLVPGYGTAAAITLGLATILMTFATEFFSHAISTTVAFGAFCVLMRERQGEPRPALVALGGLLAGLACTFEVQAGLVGVVLAAYAIARGGWLRRAGAYAGGALVGALPMLAFNTWMLGAPWKLGYRDAVAEIGVSGHAEIGLNDDGFFGITLPRLDAAGDLLYGGRGLLVLTPILVMAVIGVLIMRRSGHRAEAWTILGVAGAYFLYDAAYWQPYGGGTPGPRFLIPALPFVAVGLAYAYRARPATTLALAIPSALAMLVATITYPLLGEEGTRRWVELLADGTIEHTVWTIAGIGPNWLAIMPFLALLGGAIWFAVRATPSALPVDRADLATAAGALTAWIAVAVIGPTIAADPVTPLDGGPETFALIGTGALLAAIVLLVLRGRSRIPDQRPAAAPSPGPELALGDTSS